MQENFQDQAKPIVLETLPRKRVPVNEQCKSFLLNTVCKLYTLGFPIDWNCVQTIPSAKFVRSLTYPWHKNTFWYRESPPQTVIKPIDAASRSETKGHPFLEKVKKTSLCSGLQCWETEINISETICPRGSSCRSLLFFAPYFPARLDFPSPPLSAPRSPRMGKTQH